MPEDAAEVTVKEIAVPIQHDRPKGRNEEWRQLRRPVPVFAGPCRHSEGDPAPGEPATGAPEQDQRVGLDDDLAADASHVAERRRGREQQHRQVGNPGAHMPHGNAGGVAVGAKDDHDVPASVDQGIDELLQIHFDGLSACRICALSGLLPVDAQTGSDCRGADRVRIADNPDRIGGRQFRGVRSMPVNDLKLP